MIYESKMRLLVTASLATIIAAGFAAAPVLAQEAPAAAAEASEADPAQDIVIYGSGSSRQLTEIGALKLREVVPGSSPLKALQELPGVVFQSADGLGGYEYGVRISIRGFNQGQLGYTLDGIPLGDLAYGNYNGLTVSRAIIDENVGTIRVSQGAGALGTASTNNLGGTIEFKSNAPADKLGVIASVGLGSDNFLRAFGRIDTGEIGSLGTKAAISFVHQDADKYKGEGPRRTNQFNFKVVQPIGTDAKLTAFVNISDRREVDDQDLSFDLIKRRGLNTDYFAPDFKSAVLAAQIGANRGETGQPITNAAAGTSYAVLPYSNVTTVDDLYYAGAGLRKDQIAGATLDGAVTPWLSASLTGYFHHNRGQGDFYTPYLATPGGAPLSLRTTEYSIYRKGGIGSVDITLGNHKINAGVWYERNDFTQARRFYGLDNAATASRSPTDFFDASEAFFTQWQYKFATDTIQTHIQDSWQVTPDLNVNAGFKSVFVKDSVKTLVAFSPTQVMNGRIKSDDAFLPEAGVLFTGIRNIELFANFAKNLRPFGAAVTALSPFAAQSQAAIDLTNAGGIKPETSYSYEIGTRFKSNRLSGVVSAYYIDFRNRLGVLPVGAQIIGIPGAVANLGNVRSLGAEFAATYQLFDNVRMTGTYSYNESTYRSNVPGANGTILIATKDKTVPDAPRNLLKGDINVTQGGFFATLTGLYQGKRYVTLENDLSVPDRFLMDATAGYNFSGGPLLQGLSLQVNVTNVFDKAYIAVINSGGTAARGDSQTLLSGAPRQFYVTLRKQF